MSWKDTGFGVSFGRGYLIMILKKWKNLSIDVTIYGKKLPAYDTMYYLNILDYGQLQRMYKCGSG